MYKTVVITRSIKKLETALWIEQAANEMAEKGYELVSMTSPQGNFEVILVFKKIK